MISLYRFLFILIVLIVSNYEKAQSQNSTFKVLMTQGVVEGMKPATTTWFRIYPTIELPSQTKIRLSANSYATFLSSESVLVEFDKKGNYVLLPTKKAKQVSSFQKISNFVNQAMKSGTQSDLAGSIVRNVGKVQVQFPFDTKLLGPSVQLRWQAAKATNFEVKITDEGGKNVYTKSTKDSTLTINLLNDIREFKRGVCYYWTVSNPSITSSSSAPMCLMYHDEETVQRLEKERKQIAEELSISDKSALSWYVLGAWNEDKKLYIDALECYTHSSKLQPNVDIYKNAVNSFIKKFQTMH
ncbi:MAG: hypothetical protein IPM69_00385 [Ignavibacteria bacterium]|nr:hypothetical protein [Ignavibacteria bacterium]